MHAKVSRNGLPFFAHDARPKDCTSEGESPEHLALKRTLADVIRHAFEVQPAGMTVEEGKARTAKYRRDGIATL